MTDRNDPKWRGYFAAVVSQFTADGAVDEGAFRENIQQLADDGVHGIVIAGTTGEYWALADDERKRLFTAGAEAAAGRMTVIGGTTAATADRVIDMSKHAKAAGLDGVMIAPPPGAHPNAREVVNYYETIDRAIDIDVMIYNSPDRYGFDIKPALVSQLADLDHIAAIKESCSSFYQQTDTQRLAGDRIAILGGWPGLRGLPTLAMGCDGMVGSIEGQVLGKAPRQMYDAFMAGDLVTAREIQNRFIQLHQTVTLAAGSAPAQFKASMNLIGRPGGYPRLPILPLSPEEINLISAALVALGLELTDQKVAA